MFLNTKCISTHIILYRTYHSLSGEEEQEEEEEEEEEAEKKKKKRESQNKTSTNFVFLKKVYFAPGSGFTEFNITMFGAQIQ